MDTFSTVLLASTIIFCMLAIISYIGGYKNTSMSALVYVVIFTISFIVLLLLA